MKSELDANQSSFLIREYPYAPWVAGSVALAIGIFLYTNDSQLLASLFLGIGIYVFLSSNVMTVRIDKKAGLVSISYRSALRHKKRMIPTGDIAEIRIEHSVSRSTKGGLLGVTGRLAAELRDRKVIPFRSYFHGDLGSLRRNREALSSFLGIASPEDGLRVIENFIKASPRGIFRELQEVLTGSQGGDSMTDGVHWRFVTLMGLGPPGARWYSAEPKIADGFFYLVQKKERSGMGGISALFRKKLFRTSMAMYDFPPVCTPGLGKADVFNISDVNLAEHYFAFTSAPREAGCVLNPRSIRALVAWGERHSIVQGSSYQLSVLFSPVGTYLCRPGILLPEELEELTRLGVELAQAVSLQHA